MHNFNQLDRLLLHLDDIAIDTGAEVTVENQGRHRNDDTEGGVIQRYRDTVCQGGGVGATGWGLSAEAAAQQWR